MNAKSYEPAAAVIDFTESAIKHFETVTKESSCIGIKLSLDGGGCAGFSYKWDLVESITDTDIRDWQKSFTGWTFWLDYKSKPYLVGSTVDKTTSVAGSIIEVTSPLASSSCGCGESVSFSI